MQLDYKKIGHFISELRREKNLTQEQLSKLLFVERETVSKWERGINNPSIEVLLKLSDIFEITIYELMLGERKNKSNIKTINSMTANIMKKSIKFKKYLIFSLLIIISLTILFLSYYFINNYNSITVYEIEGSQNNYVINNGLMIVSHEKLYIQLGNVQNLQTDDVNFELYYEKGDNKNVLFYGNGVISFDVLDFSESSVEYKDLKYLVSNLYLKIELDDEVSIIKLKLSKEYSNNNIFFKKHNKLKEDVNYVEDVNVPNYIMKNFKYNDDDNCYYLETNNDNKSIKQEYYPDVKTYIVEEQEDGIIKRYSYTHPVDLSYSSINQAGDIIEEFYYDLQKKECIMYKCDDKKIKEFSDNYLSKIDFDS